MSYKAGFVGLIGRPNAGKSSLVNALVGEKVSIVSQKPQTTRQRVTGVLSDDEAQILFVDSPGVVYSETGLNGFLQKEFEDVLEKSDLLLAVLNIDENSFTPLEKIAELVKEHKKPWIAVISKTDLPQSHRKFILRDKLNECGVPVVFASAIKDPERLREELLPLIKEKLPETPAPLFDTETYTTQNLRDLCAELVREQCFEFLQQEIPYQLAVKVTKFVEDESLPKIFVDILVGKDNHKPIVVGQKGATLQKIGSAARKEIEKVLGEKVFLKLYVKARQNWMKNPQMMKEFGYVINN